ncbi:MAG: hypothetical protein IJO60_00340 [Agathobacter sp.]|nr:hypothetical protein [Agathobacter sp.]
MYERFAEWLDIVLDTDLPKDVLAFCFNLYEEEYNTWSVELIGSSEFDEEDADWACNEVFDSREYPCRWQEEAEWEDIHNKIETFIRQYLFTGRFSEVLKSYQAVAMGFVDGELTILYKSETNIQSKMCPICGKELKNGNVKVQAAGGLFNDVVMFWNPDEDKEKWIKPSAISLRLSGKGYYCDECMKVFAEFEEK